MVLGNKRGQSVIVFIMIAILVFIMATQFISPLRTQFNSTMNDASLNCSSDSISAGNRATCTVLDMGMFYFLSVCIAIGIALLSGRRTITGVLVAIFVFVAVVSLITPMKTFIIDARTDLSCGTAGISVGTNLLCIFVDLWLFYFVVTAIAAGITYVVSKRILPMVVQEK